MRKLSFPYECETLQHVLLPTGGEQTILIWAANISGAVYADGTLIASTSMEVVPLVTRIPCGTNMLAFELTRDDTDDFGLVGTFNTGWSTGISDGMYCTDNVTGIEWRRLGKTF